MQKSCSASYVIAVWSTTHGERLFYVCLALFLASPLILYCLLLRLLFVYLDFSLYHRCFLLLLFAHGIACVCVYSHFVPWPIASLFAWFLLLFRADSSFHMVLNPLFAFDFVFVWYFLSLTFCYVFFLLLVSYRHICFSTIPSLWTVYSCTNKANLYTFRFEECTLSNV